MRKVENNKTLCDYYNEIVYKVEQLTEMCGNTKEAINLRDDIYGMFTVKFSQPLDDIAELQEELGCSLDVFIKATINGIIVDGEWFSVTIHKDNNGYYFKLSNGSCFPFYLSSYKKTWWLRKDKSE